MKPKICVSIKARTIQELAWKAKRALDIGGELVELRIDYLEKICLKELEKIVLDICDRVIITVRPSWEGGQFTGGEKSRIELIEELANLGPAYIDIELKTMKEHNLRISEETDKIISWHSFDRAPNLDELCQVVSEMLKLGGIGKIVAKINGFEENLRILRLYKIYPPQKLIAFGLGEKGVPSRILSMLMGSPITYTCLPGEEVAPGQPTVGEMVEILAMLESRNIWR
ncbi:MAG: type I 3-dehydroquinate dehydratase [Nitrososphaerota archaeon]